MRLLLTGADGQVGWELARSLAPLGEVIALDREQCDLARPERMPAIVRGIKPDVIVNAAAYTAVDRAEQEEALAFLVNGTAVGVLAEEAARTDVLFIHYSTDYVFDGKKRGPYAEDDAPCPISAYGRSKLAGETALRRAGGAYLILRTSWVYAARGRNFVRTMLRLAREGDELSIVADQVGAPTWARDIAKATAAVIEASIRNRNERRFLPAILHMTASGAGSRHDLATAVINLARSNSLLPPGPLPRIRAIRSETNPLPAARPKNSLLGGDQLARRFGIVLPDWRESLALCLKEMSECERHRAQPG